MKDPQSPSLPRLRNQERLKDVHDTQTGVPLGIPRGARCVQRFDDSLNSAIHITYRISLRSSSMREPRDPLLKVVLIAYYRKIVRHSRHAVGLCKSANTPFQNEPKGEHPRGDAQKGVRWIVREHRGVHKVSDSPGTSVIR